MANSLLTLGTFSFDGLESPERIQLKTKQRLLVHHLGSGATTIDYLGNDVEIVSFQGVFSGAAAAERIRSIDFLRVQGAALPLSWHTNTVPVIIQQFELDYSSDYWIPYRLSCYVVRSVNTATARTIDAASLSPGTQLSDIASLLQSTCITPTSDQANALLTLSDLNFDTPPTGALALARSLVSSIGDQLVILADASQTGVPDDQETLAEAAFSMAEVVANYGRQCALILGCNRVTSIIAYAEDSSQS